MISLFGNADYRPGVIGTALWFAAGILYFALVGRHNLVYSPEEEFAVSMGERGHPELGDFGGSRASGVPTAPQERSS
jgi:hypothetical protein